MTEHLLFFLLWVLAGELLVAADPEPSSSSLGSFFTSGFLSSPVVTDDDMEDEDVSMGSPLHPSPDSFSFFIWKEGVVKFIMTVISLRPKNNI